MRLSDNHVVKGIAWLYLWVFRGTPVYVQLVFWGLFATIYSTIDIGVPFTEPWLSFETSDLISVFWLAVIGLALNESAYMAEIVRAGILSVDKGQDEAATALGMSWLQTMTRVVIPQAMRIIIPPTGNEVISMLKTTSLVSAIPFSLELYGRQRDISAVIFDPIPLLLVASAWYLLFTSILMVGQYFLEKRFSRGVGQARPEKVDNATGTIPLATGAITTPGTERESGADANGDTDASGKEH
jgi:polar amino acid transport system permease protein